MKLSMVTRYGYGTAEVQGKCVRERNVREDGFGDCYFVARKEVDKERQSPEQAVRAILRKYGRATATLGN